MSGDALMLLFPIYLILLLIKTLVLQHIWNDVLVKKIRGISKITLYNTVWISIVINIAATIYSSSDNY